MILQFDMTQLKKVNDELMAAREFRATYGEEGNPRSGFWFVKDEGIYMMSNAVIGETKPVICYAEGYNPETDDEGGELWDNCRDAVGGDDFCEVIPLKWVHQMIQNHPDEQYLRLKVTEKALELVTPRRSKNKLH